MAKSVFRSDVLESRDPALLKEVASSATPATGKVSLYAKTDKKLYIKIF